MTPQERQLVTELFDRLTSLEGTERDPDAERAIADGLRRAPNAAYALVQTALVQDEALRRANSRIEELEAQHEQRAESSRPTSFLSSMLEARGGKSVAPRGSVPTVRQQETQPPMAAPPYAAAAPYPLAPGMP